MDTIKTLSDTSTFDKKVEAYKAISLMYVSELADLKQLAECLSEMYSRELEAGFELCKVSDFNLLPLEIRASLLKQKLEVVQINKRMLSIENEIEAKKEFITKYEQKMVADKEVFNEWKQKADKEFGDLIIKTGELVEKYKHNLVYANKPEYIKMATFYKECFDNKFGFKDIESYVTGFKTMLNNYMDMTPTNE
jgi:hypothetical protein